jgi:hypothetical protein
MYVSIAGCIFAAIIAASAWVGLAMQFAETYSKTSSGMLALWVIFAYFTISTNVVVAVVFTFVAIDRGPRSESLIAGTMLSILLVGIVYALLLPGALELSGGSALVDRLLHKVTPVLVPVYWILFVGKGGLKWRDPWVWAIYPVGYLVYAIARGLATGKYAYPFLDVASLGWGRTALNAFVIAVVFMVSACGIVWADRMLGGEHPRQPGTPREIPHSA